jgi:hypothetical protein
VQAARALLILTLLVLGVQTESLHATVSTSRAKTMIRFKGQCDNGSGKACYDYGRLLWAMGGALDHQKALHYIYLGCHLEYKVACETYRERSTRVRYAPKVSRSSASAGAGVCFSGGQLSTARFTPNAISNKEIRGQKVDLIKPGSFWEHIGLQENDVIVKVNNMPFNNNKEALRAFSASGKKFGFEVRRAGGTITLWYSCE